MQREGWLATFCSFVIVQMSRATGVLLGDSDIFSLSAAQQYGSDYNAIAAFARLMV